MTCKELEFVLEQDGLSPLPAGAKSHLAECAACRGFVEDLFAVVNAAHALPAEVEPPERLWISLRARLESEGVIRTARPAERGSWLESITAFLRSRALATASVGLILLAAAYVEVRRTPEAPLRPAPAAIQAIPSYEQTALDLHQQELEVAQAMPAGGFAIPVNTALRDNLQIVNSFIADCQQRLKEDPTDELARENLDSAYQQKAELLAAMTDRGGSVY